MASKPARRKTQPTQPKQGEPIQIPVPKRGDFDKLLDKAAKGSSAKRETKP